MPWTLTTEQVSSTSPDGMTKLTMHHVDIMVAHAHVEMEDMETVVLVVEMGDVAVMIELFRAVTWMGEKDGGGGWWLRGESSGRVAVWRAVGRWWWRRYQCWLGGVGGGGGRGSRGDSGEGNCGESGSHGGVTVEGAAIEKVIVESTVT